MELQDCRIYSHTCNVTSDNSAEIAFKWVNDHLGGCDILVNNAGITTKIGLLDYDKSMTELSKVIEVNFTGVVRCTRHAFKSMVKRNDYGYIININSVVGHEIPGFDGEFKLSIYPGTKHAITAYTHILRQELNQMKNQKVRATVRAMEYFYSSIWL